MFLVVYFGEMQQAPLDKYHSAPDVAAKASSGGNRLKSLSMSQLKKHTEFNDFHHKPSPFNIRWVYGYNHKVGVINLNDKGSTIVFYAASNYGVLYNWTTNEMKLLQGHRHMVTCIAADAKGKWLVTADTGPENILTVWDSKQSFPQKTWFSPQGNVKISKVAMSDDSKYLLTLGYQDRAVVYWWIWSFGQNLPHATAFVEIPRDSVICMSFNPVDSTQFLLLTKSDIWIGVSGKVFVMERGLLKETDDYELKIRKPERKTNIECGKLTCYTFVKETSQILVATSRGVVIIYGYTINYQQNVHKTNYESLKYVKAFQLEHHRINFIKNVDGVIVTGNNAGQIHFYDDQMKLIYWVHGFTVDCVKSLSFNISPRSFQILDPKCDLNSCLCWEKVVAEKDSLTGELKQKLIKKKLPTEATVAGKPLVVRDFLVCTKNQGIGFVDFVTEKIETVVRNKISTATSLTVHPGKPFFCVGYSDGVIDLIHFMQYKIFVRRDLRDYFKVVTPPNDDSINGNYVITLPELAVTCLKYSPSGVHLACGLNTGELLFLDPTTIEVVTKTSFKDTSYGIKDITYSCDSLTLACSDVGKTVCVYKYDCTKFQWYFVGKHRAHYKDITTILFLPKKNANEEYKLVSLGSDRIMVEYDIGASSGEYLEILSLDRICQTPIPLTAIPWSPPKDLDPEKHHLDLPLLLIANDEHKYKLLNYETTMTLATVLGPRYENPVCRIILVTKPEDGEEYLIFATKNIIGIQKMPLDGNPWKHTALLGHPIQITQMCFREDLGTLFTIGARDACVCQWTANYRSVDTTTLQGGGDLDPYYCLIDGGRPGWLFNEIRDLFYYIQILCQGTFTPAMRRVKDYIPIDSLPDLMRALGYFPTEFEVENLLVEAKYKIFQKTPSKEVDFEEFVKLYLNHRPAFGENMNRIRNAFRNFASILSDSYSMSREDFVDMLGSYGECFPQQLSWYLLSILCGCGVHERSVINENDFSFLPENITLGELFSNILGISDTDNLSERSMMESTGSQQTGSTFTITSQSDDL